ncbi:hypothetical protein [Histidinibacterium aquaticum]|uniref:Transporter n=1 Tax=Histidinibacterium aquaticum TaxID=2613962 RepID=A0A5J5GCT9_9RHOB|nr:hypothetical protein [Histidinibacterium aquaticum]KAA9005740.1 hypothetical protein F3S47_17740 [Histidinibacterium aquaticum]
MFGFKCLPLLLAVLLVAAPLQAGPWVRERGALFLSFGANVALTDAATRPVHTDPTLYLEYGLSERVTVGFDLYVANGDQEETAQAFLRLPLAAGDTPVAATLTYGLRHDRLRASLEEIARLGVSTGRTLPKGWLAADASAILVVGENRREGKLDLTWGRDIGERWTGVLQLQTGIGTAGDAYAKAAPALLYDLRPGTRLEIGLVQALTGDLGTGLRLATWWEF